MFLKKNSLFQLYLCSNTHRIYGNKFLNVKVFHIILFYFLFKLISFYDDNIKIYFDEKIETIDEYNYEYFSKNLHQFPNINNFDEDKLIFILFFLIL